VLHGHHPRVDQFEAVEESRHLGVGPVPLLLIGGPVVPSRRLGHLLGLDIGRDLGQRQVAAGRYRRCQLGDEPVGIVGVADQVHDRDEHDRHRAAEVQRPRRLPHDRGGIAQVGVDVVDRAGYVAGQQRPGVQQDDGVVVDVDNARVRRRREHDLVRVVGGRDARADVEKLPDPGLGGQESGRPGEERPVGPDRLDDSRIGGDNGVAGRPVGGEIVLAAEPVVMHARAMRDARIDAEPIRRLMPVHGLQHIPIVRIRAG
jgi:hypothetical protein